MSATAKVIKLGGDKSKPESAEHIIIFPGGSISVCRTSDNEYWAHIEVNKESKGQIRLEECTRESKFGEIVDARLDYDYPKTGVKSIDDFDHLNHLAVRIKTC